MASLTRLRARSFLAFWSQKSALKQMKGWFRRPTKGLKLGQIDDHLARDIGLSPAELERHRMELPSQTTHHPRG